MNHGDTDHRFTSLGQILVIFGQTAIAVAPAESPLHDPPLGQHMEACQAFKPFDDQQVDAPPGPQRPEPHDEITGGGLIRPDEAEAGTPMPEDL